MNANLFDYLSEAARRAGRYCWMVHTDVPGIIVTFSIALFFVVKGGGAFPELPLFADSLCTALLSLYLMWLLVALVWMILPDAAKIYLMGSQDTQDDDE